MPIVTDILSDKLQRVLQVRVVDNFGDPGIDSEVGQAQDKSKYIISIT